MDRHDMLHTGGALADAMFLLAVLVGSVGLTMGMLLCN